jgi:hypothetical protein
VGIVVYSLRELADPAIVLILSPPSVLGWAFHNVGWLGFPILSLIVACLNSGLYALIGLLIDGLLIDGFVRTFLR